MGEAFGFAGSVVGCGRGSIMAMSAAAFEWQFSSSLRVAPHPNCVASATLRLGMITV